MGQGQKALTKAKGFQTQIDVAIAELDETEAQLEAVDSRILELGGLLSDLTDRAVVALDELESELFDPHAHADRFQRALVLTVAVRDVAGSQILDESGEMTEQSASLVVKYRPLTDESGQTDAAGTPVKADETADAEESTNE
ncbi:hypothetical protein TUM20985_27900 [Mycobacterium antarcticum]|nr:hypothetical protein TUM20985_27900 [Mycolicibacterium sp. TUM20985]GLP84200.1 hypothetical protein TUM20984_56200 [Mycolicibacterium sp. TUM20984]